MTNELETKKPVSLWRLRIVSGIGLVGSALVGTVSAIDLSGVTDIIDDVTLLFPGLVAVVIAVIPILVILAIVGFILGLFDGILGKIRM
jgi:hypothetical protein